MEQLRKTSPRIDPIDVAGTSLEDGNVEARSAIIMHRQEFTNASSMNT